MSFIPSPESVELHLTGSPEFSRFSKQVKAIGGKYTACRGHSNTRFVYLPFTDEGRSLANKLVAEFGGSKHTTMIMRGLPSSFRGQHIHAPVVVHYIARTSADPCEDLLDAYESAFLRAFPNATEPEPVPEPKPEIDEDDLPVTLTITRAQARTVLAALSRRCNELEILGGPDAEALSRETREIYQAIDHQTYSAH